MPDYPTPNNSCDLTGQVALVTGTTSGLGWRFATVLAKAGAKVALTGRRTERLDELAALIRADGGECEPFRLDMTDIDDVQNARIESFDERLRSVEQAVVELSQLSKWIKYGVMVLAATLGIDLQTMV